MTFDSCFDEFKLVYSKRQIESFGATFVCDYLLIFEFRLSFIDRSHNAVALRAYSRINFLRKLRKVDGDVS